MSGPHSLMDPGLRAASFPELCSPRLQILWLGPEFVHQAWQEFSVCPSLEYFSCVDQHRPGPLYYPGSRGVPHSIHGTPAVHSRCFLPARFHWRKKRERVLSLYHPSLLSAPPAPQGRVQLSHSLSPGAQGPSLSSASLASQNALLSLATGGAERTEGASSPTPKCRLDAESGQGPTLSLCTRNPLEMVL